MTHSTRTAAKMPGKKRSHERPSQPRAAGDGRVELCDRSNTLIDKMQGFTIEGVLQAVCDLGFVLPTNMQRPHAQGSVKRTRLCNSSL